MITFIVLIGFIAGLFYYKKWERTGDGKDKRTTQYIGIFLFVFILLGLLF